MERNQMPERTKLDNHRVLAGDRSPRLTAINAGKSSSTASGSRPVPMARKRMSTQLKLPTRGRNLDAVTAIIGDWLVPLLVKEFLADHKASNKTIETSGMEPTTETDRRKS